MSLFCDTDLATRIERAEAHLIGRATEATHRRRADGAGFVIPVAGGVATFAETDSPFNKVAGLGFEGAPTDEALDEIEQAYAARGVSTQIELAHLADPAIGTRLTERGYRLASFENVLGRALADTPEWVAPPGIEVRPIREDELERWLDVVAEGVAHPDQQGLPAHEDFPREAVVNAERDFVTAGVTPYLAWLDGVVAGGGSMRLAAGIAQLTGAATAPAHRRRGVQAALLLARMSDAAVAGGDVAVVSTQPGSTSQHNVQRQGFDLLYTRAVLVKRP